MEYKSKSRSEVIQSIRDLLDACKGCAKEMNCENTADYTLGYFTMQLQTMLLTHVPIDQRPAVLDHLKFHIKAQNKMRDDMIRSKQQRKVA